MNSSLEETLVEECRPGMFVTCISRGTSISCILFEQVLFVFSKFIFSLQFHFSKSQKLGRDKSNSWIISSIYIIH